MELRDYLKDKREALLEGWFDHVVSTYPGLSAIFLKKKHQFGNPVGVNTRAALSGLLDELLRERPSDAVNGLVDTVIRIRAVQDFAPSQAVGAFFMLKDATRELLGSRVRDPELIDSLLEFESRVDGLGLIAFDIYATCREQVYDMRLKDSQQRFSGLLRRAHIISDIPGGDSGIGD